MAPDLKAGASSFVVRNGVELELGGAPYAFVGSNFYRLALSDAFGSSVQRVVVNGKPTFPQIDRVLQNYAAEGIKVVRFWGFSCEGSRGSSVPSPLIKRDFSLSPEAWQQVDYAIAAAGRRGLKVIIPLVNFEHEYCGMEWWVEMTAALSSAPAKEGWTRSCYNAQSRKVTKIVNQPEDCGGEGEPVFTKELFYNHPKVWQKYAAFVTQVLNRKNTYSGIALKDDPAIFAVELANEPHTSDYYECLVSAIGRMTSDQCAKFAKAEYMRRFKPGTLVYQWLTRASKLVKSLDRKHIVMTGEEGYRVDHSDPSCLDRHEWIHNGSKGVDFVRNASIPTIDVLTTHFYPDNWGLAASELEWFNTCVIQDRAKIAIGHGKPIMLEETGFNETPYPGKPDNYRQDRGYYISKMLGMAARAGYLGTMVWQAAPLTIGDVVAEDDSFTFPIKTRNNDRYDYSSEGRAVRFQVECMKKVQARQLIPEQCVYLCPRGAAVNGQNRGRWASGETCSL